MGGLPGVYYVAWAIVSLNAILLYTLLRKVSGGKTFALAAALAYCAFPADTTQAYLTMAFGGQTSITILLLAAHCYFSRWRPFSYAIALGSLLCYETVFPLFLAVPLLERDWNRSWLRRLAGGGVFVAAALAGVALLRKATGEGFVSALNAKTALTLPFQHMVIGPKTALAMFFYRPWATLAQGIPPHWGILTLAGVCTAGLLFLASRDFRWSGPDPVRRVGKLALAGFVFLVLAYPLTFTVPASMTYSRATRVHLAAAIGTAILWGAISAGLLRAGRAWWLRGGIAALLGLLLAGQLAFGFVIQRDYSKAWAYQRSFWTDIIHMCPDIDPGTVVLVEESGLRGVRQINPWGWNMPYILKTMFDIPGPYTPMPLVYLLQWHWREKMAETGNVLDVVDLKGWRLEKLKDPRYILLEWNDHKKLQRATGPMELGDYELQLRPPVPAGEPPYRKRLLYHLLVVKRGQHVRYYW